MWVIKLSDRWNSYVSNATPDGWEASTDRNQAHSFGSKEMAKAYKDKFGIAGHVIP